MCCFAGVNHLCLCVYVYYYIIHTYVCIYIYVYILQIYCTWFCMFHHHSPLIHGSSPPFVSMNRIQRLLLPPIFFSYKSCVDAMLGEPLRNTFALALRGRELWLWCDLDGSNASNIFQYLPISSNIFQYLPTSSNLCHFVKTESAAK